MTTLLGPSREGVHSAEGPRAGPPEDLGQASEPARRGEDPSFGAQLSLALAEEAPLPHSDESTALSRPDEAASVPQGRRATVRAASKARPARGTAQGEPAETGKAKAEPCSAAASEEPGTADEPRAESGAAAEGTTPSQRPSHGARRRCARGASEESHAELSAQPRTAMAEPNRAPGAPAVCWIHAGSQASPATSRTPAVGAHALHAPKAEKVRDGGREEPSNQARPAADRHAQAPGRAESPAPQDKPASHGPIATAPMAEQAPVPLEAARPPLPALVSPLLSEAAQDASLRLGVLTRAAHLSLHVDGAGDLALHVRVRDGTAEIRVDGAAAPLLNGHVPELRAALASEGLQLGQFDLPREQQRNGAEAPEPSERPQRPLTPEPGAADGAAAPVSSRSGVHVRA